MLLKHSKGNLTPNTFSDHERTYNHAIDLVAEAVGWAKKHSLKPLSAVVLKPTQHMLFVRGMEVLMKKELFPNEIEGLEFEGIRVLRGSMGQIDSIRLEFVENKIQIPKTLGHGKA